MVKHNNAIDKTHCRKDWKRFVRQNLNQAGKKVARRSARLAKAKAMAPRPTSLLRPSARGCTIKYNSKLRAGRGFTVEELAAAKINVKTAKTIGIAVDYRRVNRSQESLDRNVARLKQYKAKLVVFPRGKVAKSGDSTDAAQSQATQVFTKNVIAIDNTTPAPKARKITSTERNTTVTAVLRKALTDNLRWGPRLSAAAMAAAKKKK